MRIAIQVTKRWCHPHFGGDKHIVKTFYSLPDAADYYRRQKKNDCEFQHTTIQVVEELESTNGGTNG